MKNRTLFCLAVLALAGCAPEPGLDRSGAGAPAPLIYAPIGTRITLANTADGAPSTRQITAAPGTGLRGAYTDGGAGGSFYPGCWGCGAPSVIDETAYARLWPLETGKSVSFLRTDPDGTKHRVAISVAGTERIETPAGRFDTWLLKGRLASITGPRFVAEVDAWWAPEPGWVIRARGRASDGRRLTSEVTEIAAP